MQDRIFEYRRAAIEDIEELVRTRILVLRAALKRHSRKYGGDGMRYYQGNGVYRFLENCEQRGSFYWTGRNLWLLIYGDEYNEPRVLTVASGMKLDVQITEDEKRALNVAKQLTKNTDLPINFVRFDPAKPFEQVRYWEQGMHTMPVLSDMDLRERFEQYGLTMNEKRAKKSINDKGSSTYHEWQRTHMGDSILAVDIDLLRLDNGRISEMIELKRSHKDIKIWEPYEDDYNNFILLSRLARKTNLDFYIVYNHRTKKPFMDDVSIVKLFEFDHRTQPYCRYLTSMTMQQFAAAGTTRER